ncbi:hypothetical protein [Vibrio harveyi]|uniref:hypothetical protein n=1 Tax=Vibrio harveyi TaxID=669 RepID=UPI003CF7BE66
MRYCLAIPASYEASSFVRELEIKFEMSGLLVGHDSQNNNIYIMAEIQEDMEFQLDITSECCEIMGETYKLASSDIDKHEWVKSIEITGITRGMTVTESAKFTRKTINELMELLQTHDFEVFVRI